MYSTVSELQDAEINFHIKSDLINNFTPMRQAVFLEIIRRISLAHLKNV